MKLNQPLGNPIYAPTFVRLTLGAYFIMAGLAKFDDIPGFIRVVQEYKILSPQLSVLYGATLPYLEIIGGVFLMAGIWTSLAAIITSFLLLSFVVAFGIGSAEGRVFNKDIILLAASLSLLYSGGGAMSVDRFRASGS